MRYVGRSVAVAVAVITGRTMGRKFLAPRRLCKLPDRCERSAARRGSGRILRKNASRRRRARIVVSPKNKFAWRFAGTDVLCRRDRTAGALFHRDSRTIHSSAKSGVRKLIGKTAQIRVICCRKAAAVLDVEKNNRTRGKSFCFGGRRRAAGVHRPQFFRSRFRFQFVRVTSAIQNNKSEVLRAKKFALAGPSVFVCFVARRRRKPETRISKIVSEHFHSRVARILIAIEAKIASRRSRR